MCLTDWIQISFQISLASTRSNVSFYPYSRECAGRVSQFCLSLLYVALSRYGTVIERANEHNNRSHSKCGR
jgi:hypothetical protein